jgi:hypothetical protein
MMLKRGAFYRLSKKSKIRTPCCIRRLRSDFSRTSPV